MMTLRVGSPIVKAVRRSSTNITGPYHLFSYCTGKRGKEFVQQGVATFNAMKEGGGPNAQFLGRYEANVPFLRSFFLLEHFSRTERLGSVSQGAILDETAQLTQEFGRRYHGDDLLEKVMRTRVPGFLGGNPQHASYELFVARYWLEQYDIQRIAPIPTGDEKRPDYRVWLASGGVFLAEAKLHGPMVPGAKVKSGFYSSLSSAQKQLSSFSNGSSGVFRMSMNSIHLGVLLTTNRVDLDVERTRFTRMLQQRETQFIGQVRVDFFGPGKESLQGRYLGSTDWITPRPPSPSR